MKKPRKSHIAALVSRIEELKTENYQTRAGLRSVTEQRDRAILRAETAENRTERIAGTRVFKKPELGPIFDVRITVDAHAFKYCGDQSDFVCQVAMEAGEKLMRDLKAAGY